ncbi:biotin/lipoate A/B protein ligase family protein [Hyphobacterium sp. HN65]|uniref:Biotin/lipoate A/B protein ligase family protein n=1 Tax=Hyphobacterium lacteum TaxID=3116575 RepID=A0ABU7LQ74_9PROT|nr:biotin/lipoate A/B protein ligase family protein [Hyphobacterium sp. HN65]MEE2525744.1 biotin/lipoate A/B protein ligase family protein [Hyphobacterium sp. HN65]
MSTIFRVIDTGLREGRANIAFDQAMIDARQASEIPDTIRFIHFPPTALVGRHQSLSKEIRLEACAERGVGLARRITGGGAIYLDEGQLGWAIVCNKASLGTTRLDEVTRKICEAAAVGLSTLGIKAAFRPRNDIEVDGRKISGTGGFFDGGTLIFQGTVLVDLDPLTMLSALNVPQEKLAKRALDDAGSRIVTLRELLGEAPSLETVKAALIRGFEEHLGIECIAGEPTAEEERAAAVLYDEEIGKDDFVYEISGTEEDETLMTGSYTGLGGTATAHVRVEGAGNDRIREVLITGDFFITPPRIIYDLEASLRGKPVSEAGRLVREFFAAASVGMLSISPDDFAAAVEIALGQREPQTPKAGVPAA